MTKEDLIFKYFIMLFNVKIDYVLNAKSHDYKGEKNDKRRTLSGN